jgi:hypothetical protein
MIKKTSYELGDLVLVNHPELKKGLARSLAARYYGPFEIVGKYKNGCDYLIREHGHPRARIKQIHRNRLIAYFKRGHPHDRSIDTHESTHENTTKKKRSYKKIQTAKDGQSIKNHQVNLQQRLNQVTTNTLLQKNLQPHKAMSRIVYSKI